MGKFNRDSLKGDNLKRNIENVFSWMIIIGLVVIMMLIMQGKLSFLMSMIILLVFGGIVTVIGVVIYAWEQKFENEQQLEHADSIILKTFTEIGSGGGQFKRFIGSKTTQESPLSEADRKEVENIIKKVQKDLDEQEVKMEELMLNG